MEMSEDQFEAKYKPQINHIIRANAIDTMADEDICSFSGRLFETFGEEMEYVVEMAKKNRVVTIIEGEDEMGDDNEMHSTLYIVSGCHLVNRIGYLVVCKPLEEEFEIKLDW